MILILEKKVKLCAFEVSSNSSNKNPQDSQFKRLKTTHTNYRLDSALQDLVSQ